MCSQQQILLETISSTDCGGVAEVASFTEDQRKVKVSSRFIDTKGIKWDICTGCVSIKGVPQSRKKKKENSKMGYLAEQRGKSRAVKWMTKEFEERKTHDSNCR